MIKDEDPRVALARLLGEDAAPQNGAEGNGAAGKMETVAD